MTRPEPEITGQKPVSDGHTFLTSAQVRQRYGGCSAMWVHRRLHDDSRFPEPMFIGKRRFWKLAELLEWERSRAKAEA